MNEIRTINAELMFLNWNDSATGGGKLIFAVGPDDLEKFKTLTRKEGKKPGQRFMAAFALVDEHEQPERIGPLCTLAVTWCRDPDFQDWLAARFSEQWDAVIASTKASERAADLTAEALRRVLAIKSRRDLDTDAAAARRFTTLIRAPYRAYLGRS